MTDPRPDLGSAAAHAPEAATLLAALRDERCMGLETRKRDGSWVSTPVNLVVDGDRIYFRTWSKAGKAKRLRNFPDVRLAGSDWRGRVRSPRLCGTARLLDGEEDGRAAASINQKYPLLQGVAVRYGHRLMRYRTQHYVVSGLTPC
jgi:PPOX class probable F420-dependent enzyme